MRIALALSFATLLLSLPLRAQPETPVSGAQALQRALALLDVPDYAGALAALEQGLLAEGNERQTLVGLYELHAVITASLRDSSAALESFQRLLSLEPDFRPTRDYSPRVRGPYLEARAWLSDHPPLRFAPLPPGAEAGLVKTVGATVSSDPLRLAREVRFHQQDARGTWVQEKVALRDGQAQAMLVVPGSGWWAELLGDHQAVLSRIGSRDQPIAQAPSALTRSSPALAPHHVLSLSLVAAGVATVAAGGWFGAQSASHLETIRTAERDGQGRVIGLTQPQAFAHERQARTDAIVANVLFASGMALAAGGATTWFFGGRVVGVRGTF